MSDIKLHSHNARMAVAIKQLWNTHIKPTTTQNDFAKRYGFEQNFISQVFHFRSRATHALICAIAKELSIQPLEIDPSFNEPNRFRK